MTEVIATDERGNALLSFQIGEEADLDNLDPDLPCLFSLVLVWHERRCHGLRSLEAGLGASWRVP